jgi:hypothetical protein
MAANARRLAKPHAVREIVNLIEGVSRWGACFTGSPQGKI